MLVGAQAFYFGFGLCCLTGFQASYQGVQLVLTTFTLGNPSSLFRVQLLFTFQAFSSSPAFYRLSRSRGKVGTAPNG